MTDSHLIDSHLTETDRLDRLSNYRLLLWLHLNRSLTEYVDCHCSSSLLLLLLLLSPSSTAAHANDCSRSSLNNNAPSAHLALISAAVPAVG